MIEILLALLPFALGIFHEWTAGIISVVLLVFIMVRSDKRSFKIPKDPLFISSVLIPVFFLVSPLWAVDRGMTVLGFTKFLPVPLFLILLKNTPKPEDPFKFLPVSGASMTVLSFILSLIFPQEGWFLVSGRLAGFFQYPNTFALFLLVCLSLSLLRSPLSKKDLFCIPFLLTGIIMSGSRTVFILMVLFFIFYIISVKDRKLKFITLAVTLTIVIGVGLYAFISGDRSSVGRVLTTSLGSSTFVGRFLYFKDVIPQILKHPLGLGYKGYSYLQTSFQTGVYSVDHVHNDLLQILIDVGWIPSAVLCYSVIKRFIRIDMRRKVTVVIMVLHILFDFDMQFVSMLIIFFVLLYDHEGKDVAIKNKISAIVPITCAVLMGTYFAIPSLLGFFREDRAAVKVYPAYTDSYVALIGKAENAEEMEKIADRILKYNDSVSIAYSAKARVSFSEGDVIKMIEYKEKAIDRNRYGITEYTDYMDMLAVCTNMYIDAGKYDSAKYCIDKIKEIPVRLEKVRNGTSALAYRIDDKPELDLPDEYRKIIDSLG